jgi:hypothetical protein
MRPIAALGIMLLAVLCGGCASVTQGTTHSLRIETVTDKGVDIADASCTLTNDTGTTVARSGRSTIVRRSSKDLEISCSSSGQPEASGKLTSRANIGLAGNVLLGGAIGAVVDHNTGAAYTYPSWVRLVFGRYAVFDRRDEIEGTAMQAPGTPAITGASVAAHPDAAKAPERRLPSKGDRFEYRIDDRASGRTYTVVLRTDRVEDAQVSFNDGVRIEKLSGAPVLLQTALVGELDSVTPPGGWMPDGRMPYGMWNMRHRSIVPTSHYSYELQASVEGSEKLRISGMDLQVTRVVLRGWVEYRGSLNPMRSSYTGTAWLSPELGRVVRFEAKARAGANAGVSHFEINERVELVRIERE